MKNYFFITGLPRSRTAWLANYLTYGNAFCFHDEAFAGTNSVAGIASLLETAPFDYVGISNPAVLIFEHRFREIFPDAKWVFIRRNKVECAEQFAPTGFTPEMAIRLDAKLDRLSGLNNSLTVPFEKLDSMTRQIAEFVAPGFHSPAPRDAMLHSLNVQITMENVVKGMNDPKYRTQLYKEAVI